MEKGPLSELLLERYEEMPPQLKIAARFVLDHPEEVALSSMREQAAQAGVSHSTMMRLARWLGMDGFEDMRSSYASALRKEPPRGRGVSTSPAEPGLDLASLLADSTASQVARLGEILSAERIVAAARVVVASTAIFALGSGYGLPAARQLARDMTVLFPERNVRDISSSDPAPILSQAEPDSVLVAIGGKPYERHLVDQVERASRVGIKIVAVTDSPVSPIARLSKAVVPLTPVPASRLRSAVPALAAVEILSAVVASQAGLNIEARLQQQDQRLEAFGAFWRSSHA